MKKTLYKQQDEITSVRFRQDGRWESRYYDPTVGKYHSVYAYTEEECLKKAIIANEKLKRGIYKPPNTMTLGEWLNKWYTAHSLQIKYSTSIEYERYIKKRIAPALGNIKLPYLTADHIQAFYKSMLADGDSDGLSPKTIRNIHNMLHSALEDAVKQNVIEKNVSEYTTLPRIIKQEMQFLNITEETKLYDCCKNERLGLGVIIGLHTGMRSGEILALTWDNMDFEQKIIMVRKTQRRIAVRNPAQGAPKTQIVEEEPKTVKSLRNIPIDDILFEHLIVLRETQTAEKELLQGEYTDNGHIICFQDGSLIEQRTYEDFYKKMLKKSGVKNITFHALRHTFAARAIEAGIDLYTLSSLLGHSSIQITLDYYAHLSDQGKRLAIDKLSKFRNKN
jgi:integrase